MTYALNGSIQAADYNTLVTGAANGVNTPTVAALNTVWAVGTGDVGYGHAPTAAETVGATVVATGKWANLVSKTANAASHQGTSITAVTVPATGDSVKYHSVIPTNLTAIYNNSWNAVTQGSTSANTATCGSTWSQYATFTHTATFANGDAARYFFNSGGQLALTFAHPTGTGINLNLYNLAVACGTIVMSAPSSGTCTIASTSYSGITKIGGSGSPTTYTTNNGYFAQSTANVLVFQQNGGGGGYLDTFISVTTKTNGTQGSNGDKGSVVTIYTVFDEVPNGLTAASGSAVTLTLRPPSTTYISNNWGAITLSGTNTGSL